MPNLSGKSRYPIDAALILRNVADGAVTADTDFAVQKLVSTGAVWQNPADVRDGRVAVVVKVGAFAGDSTVTALAVEIFTATDAAKSNPKLYASFPVDSLGVAEIDLDQVSMLKRHPVATHWFVRLNVAGSAPSIASAFAYISAPSSI